jgi:nifR3 family TIM-barrel protein
MKIGLLKINGKIFLAPMADYTNIAFRVLCKEYGAALVYTELISAKAINLRSKKTRKMLDTSLSEKPVFLQLFGNNPIEFEKAIEYCERELPESFAGYDLNCGCAVPKARKGQYGCFLMDYPKLVAEIIVAMKKKTKKPVTLKIRLGMKEETYLDVAKSAEKAGADAICIHPRLGINHYSGKADWNAIKKIKKLVKIPVIGNGDIETKKDMENMFEETGCDFVMVGRKAIGNAFIFKHLKTGKERTGKDRVIEAERYIELAEEFKLGINDIRGYFIGLPSGIKGASELRNAFATARTSSEIKLLLKQFKDKFVAN